MDKILPSYSDPLFSILIITILILIVALVSYFLGNYKEERERENLKKFLGTISVDKSILDIDKLPFETSLISPLSMVAKNFSIKGEYQKAIRIYLYLINHIQPFFQKEYLLQELGETYLRAGFLRRAESIFLEILKKHPRNREVLYSLETIYERLNEYNRAKETLIPLETMGENIEKLRVNLELSSFLKDSTISKEERVEKLIEFIKKEPFLYRRAIRELFKTDINSAWSNLDMDRINSIIDILWFLPSSNLNFDIISSNEILKSIYTAKGILHIEDSLPNIGIFVIDTINSAQKGGSFNIDLNFSYSCSRCRDNFPISFDRCPRCYAINTIVLNTTITEKRAYRGYSLL